MADASHNLRLGDSPIPRLVCLGEPLMEFNQSGRDGGYLPFHGGDTANCAVAAARQGCPVGYVSRLGCDDFGASFRALWTEENIDHRFVADHPTAPTGLYFVHHGPGGHRFSYRRAGSAASLLTPDDIPLAYLQGAWVLQLSGISLAISPSACDAGFHAMASAREAGVRVAFDTNWRQALWPLPRAKAIIHAAVALCHIALPGYDDAVALTGLQDPDAIVDCYLGLGPEVVALTLGSGGVLVATGDERRRLPAHAVTPLDATGAGDAFDGAFLAEVINGRDPFAAARYANVAAALATEGYGAVPPIPRRGQVEAALGCLTDD